MDYLKPHVNFYVNIESEEYEYDLILVVKYFLFFFSRSIGCGLKVSSVKRLKSIIITYYFQTLVWRRNENTQKINYSYCWNDACSKFPAFRNNQSAYVSIPTLYG